MALGVIKIRRQRKVEHIENYLKSEYVGETYFDDVVLEHNAIPELNFSQIDTSTEFLEKRLSFPLVINSMTGGGKLSYEINESLAEIALEYGLAMAVGSQRIGLEEEDCVKSFTVVRDVLGYEVPVIGNLSALSTPDEVSQAVEMIDADAIQLHLNVAQELVMEIGDRNFEGMLDNIAAIAEKVDVPVIAKEVGFGIGPNEAKLLIDRGIKYVDIAGAGGTNFIEIEDLRVIEEDYTELYSWGNPTAYLLEKYKDLEGNYCLIASGGVRNASHIVKSLVMGADMAGISGEILNYLIHGNQESAGYYINSLIHKTKIMMLLMGAKELKDLKDKDYKILGELRELL